MQCVPEALSLWGVDDAEVRPLSLSENATYAVRPRATASGSAARPGARYALRLHRPGYRTASNIRSELAWVDALDRESDVETAAIVPTLRGDCLGEFVGRDGAAHYAVLQAFLEGKEPLEDGLERSAARIGGVAAALHRHAARWERPEGFDRIVWDERRILGADSDYGDWRDTPEVDANLRALLELAEAKVLDELAAYGKSPETFGLIHTDLRSSNLLIDDAGSIKVLDFDDCGFGWYAFDVACTFSFEEANPRLDDMVLAYLRGYRAAGGVLSTADFARVPAMLMARRLMLVAWVEKRRETAYARQIRGWYVSQTRRVAQAYLDGRYLPRTTAAALGGGLSAVA